MNSLLERATRADESLSLLLFSMYDKIYLGEILLHVRLSFVRISDGLLHYSPYLGISVQSSHSGSAATNELARRLTHKFEFVCIWIEHGFDIFVFLGFLRVTIMQIKICFVCIARFASGASNPSNLIGTSFVFSYFEVITNYYFNEYDISW